MIRAFVLLGAIYAVVAVMPHRAKAQTREEVASQLKLDVATVNRLQTERGLSLQQLAKAPPATLPRLLRRLDYPDLPLERLRFRALQIYGNNPPDLPGAAARATMQFQQLQSRTDRVSAAGLPVGKPERSRGPLTAGVNKEGWKWLGPDNVGGRTRAIVIHPEETQTMWVGAVGGGVWRSDNGGQTWRPLDNLLSNSVITCLIMDPNDPRKLWAGTGEHVDPVENYGAMRGDGLFVSTDSGETWSQLPSTIHTDFRYVRRLAIAPDGGTLLAATSTGIFRSTDSGQSWTRTWSGQGSDVDFNPRDRLHVIAGGMFDGRARVSSDGGVTWKETKMPNLGRLARGDGRVEVEFAKADPQIVYISVNANSGMLLRSNDGGQSASIPNIEYYNYLGNQGMYDHCLWAGDPTNADLVVLGGLTLWKSTDGGKNLTEISAYWAKTIHPDQHTIVADPKFDGVMNKRVFIGNDGGVYKTDDISTAGTDEKVEQGWVGLNSGYGVTQFYHAAGDARSGTIVAGAQDNGTSMYREGSGWSMAFGGDGGFCAVDPDNPQVLYVEAQNLALHRSDDGGQTFEPITGPYRQGSFPAGLGRTPAWKAPPYQISDARVEKRALFITPYLLDPNNSNRLLVGGLSLWRTNDAKAPLSVFGGPQWTSIKDAAEDGQLISIIAVAPGNSDIMWVGHVHGDVYYTENGTAEKPVWQQVATSALPNRWCSSIAIHPTDPKIVYVTFRGYTRENVWKTIDGGKTWQSLGAGTLPEAGAQAITVHPKRPEFVYLGTQVGLCVSEDAGATWHPVNYGPANCCVEGLFWMGDRLVAATYGRGIYSIEVKL